MQETFFIQLDPQLMCKMKKAFLAWLFKISINYIAAIYWLITENKAIGMASSATKPWFSSVHHFLFYFIHTQDEVGSVEAQLLKAEMASFQVSTLKLWPGKARLWQKSSTVSSLKISPLLQPSHSHHPIPIGSLSTINTPPPLRTPYSI